MLSRRFIVLLLVAGVGAALVVGAALRDGAGDAVAPAPQVPVATSPTEAASSPATTPGATLSPVAGDAEILAAVRSLKRFCDLVDDGDLRAAGRLLAGAWVWPRRELLVIARLSFMSARVQTARSADDVVLLTRVRARLRGPSPLHDGVNTLFFTLGRDGTTGGWLVTAVTSSP